MKFHWVVLLLLLGCSKSKDAQPTGPLEGKTVVFIGDSITTGYMSSSPDKRWTTLFTTNKKAVEDNLGVVGEVLQHDVTCTGTEHPVFDQASIPAKTNAIAVMFIALGMNDVGMNNGKMTPNIYQSNLSSIIDYAIATRGWKSSQIIIVTATYTTVYDYFIGQCGTTQDFDDTRLQSYVNAALAVATSKGCMSANLYSAMSKSSSLSSLLSSDGLHPNDQGYAFIAGTLEAIDFSGI